MLSFIKKVSDRLENMKLSLPEWAAAFFTVSLLRNFFEGMLESTHSIGGGSGAADSFRIMLLHYNLEWLALLMVLVLIFRLTAKTPVIKLLKITLVFYSIIIVVPFIDFFVYYPKGSRVLYLFTPRDYARCLMYFFAFNVNIKVSAGVRFEVFAAFVISFLYAFSRTKNVLRGALSSVLVYFFAVSSMCFPVFSLLPVLPFKGAGANAFITAFFSPAVLPGYPDCIMIIFLLFILLPSVLYLHDAGRSKKFLSLFVIKPRALLYPALVFSGFFMAAKNYDSGVFFKQAFTPAFILACLMLALLVFIISSMLKSVHDPKTSAAPFAAVLSAALFLCAALSLSISFPVFLLTVLILAVFSAVSLPPFGMLLPGPGKKGLEALVYILLVFSGFAAVYGADTPLYFTAQNLALFSALFVSVISAVNIKKPGFAGKIL